MEFETIHKVALWGFLGAMIFGAVANKTHFCTMGAISDWVNIGIKTRFRAWMLAMGIALVITQVMHAMGWLDLSQSIYLTTNLGWLGYVVGGIIFGVGMTIGSGCGQRTLVRIGGGNLKSLVVFLVMGVTAYMTLRGLLAIVRIEAFNRSDIDLSKLGLSDQSLGSILAQPLGMTPSLMSMILTTVIGLGLFYFAFGNANFRKDNDSILASITIGLLSAGAWYVTGVIGYDDFEPIPVEGFTFVAPTGNTVNYLMTYTGSTINFGIAVVFGVIAGSFIYAVATRTFRIETFASRSDLINHLLGGFMMGFGGVLALGCTIGQGVSGMSTLAIGSVMALASIIFGSVLSLKMQYHLLDEAGFGRAFAHSLADLRLLPRSVSGG